MTPLDPSTCELGAITLCSLTFELAESATSPAILNDLSFILYRFVIYYDIYNSSKSKLSLLILKENRRCDYQEPMAMMLMHMLDDEFE